MGVRTALTLAPVNRIQAAAWLIACVVVLAWGFNFVLSKHALEQFGVGPFNFLRFGGMVVTGWLLLWATGGIRCVQSRDRRRLLVVAVVGYCGYVFGFSVGLDLTSAFSASLLLALVPLWIVVIHCAIDRRLPSVGSGIALALAAGGVVLFVLGRTSVSVGWGDFISLGVAGLYAAYLVLNRPLIARYPSATLITYGATIAALPILSVTSYTLMDQDWSAVSSTGWLAMAWATVGPVLVAWTAWNWVQRHLPTTRVAPLLFLVPVISGYSAWWILSESIGLGQILGTAAVVGGLLLSHRANRAP